MLCAHIHECGMQNTIKFNRGLMQMGVGDKLMEAELEQVVSLVC